MMNWIWLVLIGASVIAGICTGTIGAVQDNLFSFADTAVELALGLIGVMAFFCGLMKIMEEAGLCASDVIQYYATPGKLVIEAIRDPELLQEVYGDEEEAEAGDCSGCPFREDGT